MCGYNFVPVNLYHLRDPLDTLVRSIFYSDQDFTQGIINILPNRMKQSNKFKIRNVCPCARVSRRRVGFVDALHVTCRQSL